MTHRKSTRNDYFDVNKIRGEMSLLHMAILNQDITLCEHFIKEGANVDQRTECQHRNTPLILCSSIGNFEICKLLLKNGACVNLRDFYYCCTPLSIACRDGNIRICNILIEYGAQIDLDVIYPPLLISSANGYLEICKLLLEKGADVNINKSSHHLRNETPLSLAVKNGHFDICKLLLEKGADIQSTTNVGEPIIFCASEKGFISICKLLLENGADVNHKFLNFEYTPIYLISKGFPLQNLLSDIDKGKKVNYNVTPIYAAAKRKHFEVCKLLIEYGADLNQIIVDYLLAKFSREGNLLSKDHIEIYEFLKNHRDKLIYIVLNGNKFDKNSFIHEDTFPFGLIKIILFYAGFPEIVKTGQIKCLKKIKVE